MIIGRILKNTLILKDAFSEGQDNVQFFKSALNINEIIEDLSEGQNAYIDKNKNLHVKEIKEVQVLE